MDSSRLSPTSPLTPDRSWSHPCSVKDASPFDLSAPSHSHETPLQNENSPVNPESTNFDHHVSNAFHSTSSEKSQEFRAAAKASAISRLWGGAGAAATALPACGRQGCGVDGPAAISRPLTGDEELWWRAMHGGTGVCVVGLQISGHVSIDEVRAAIETLSARHPVLSARIIKPPKSHQPELHVCRPPQPITVRECDTADVATADESDCQNGMLHRVVESELNTPMVDGRDHPGATNNRDKGEASVDVFQIHVYASHSSTLVALRSHIAALDEHSAPPIAAEFLEELRRVKKHLNRDSSSSPSSPSCSSPTSSPSSSPSPSSSSFSSSEDQTAAPSLPPPLAALLPKALSAKSSSVKGTFAQAFNAVGYVRNALISSHLPFEPGRADSRKNSFTTRFATVTFTKEETSALLAAAESHGCSLFSLECAAGLKAAARMKQLGGRTEVFSLGSAIGCRTILGSLHPQTALLEKHVYAASQMKSCNLFPLRFPHPFPPSSQLFPPHPPPSSAIGCRTILDPPLPQTALGEYMSMLPLKQEVSEKLPFWDVATSISAHAESALQRQQQFTDMPVLELLFSTVRGDSRVTTGRIHLFIVTVLCWCESALQQ
ncbi:unnamed protein product [Closterium sp. NIES-65]|nr:unnamed protein product [Closterium sp. NIES-65]